MNKFRSMCLLVVVFIIIYLGGNLNLGFGVNVEQEVKEIKIIEIQIKQGDTMWNLARKYTPDNKDVRETLHEIRIINNLESFNIYPGQIIKMPIEEYISISNKNII